MKPEALLARLVAGVVNNVSFSDAQKVLEALNFEELREKGSHHVYSRRGIPEQLNLQRPRRASEALPTAAARCPCPPLRFKDRGERVMAAVYPIDVFWSEEDNSWVADVPDLAYCSATGETPHEAVAEVELAIEVWLESARSSGRTIPTPSSRAVRA